MKATAMKERIPSVLALILPPLIGALYATRQSHAVSWIYAMGALASIPLVGLPLGIGANLLRLKFPIIGVIVVVLSMMAAAFLHLLPKGPGGGADDLMPAFLLMLFFYLITFFISIPNPPWAGWKLLTVLMLMAFSVGVSGVITYQSRSSTFDKQREELLERIRLNVLGGSFLRKEVNGSGFVMDTYFIETESSRAEVLGSYGYAKKIAHFESHPASEETLSVRSVDKMDSKNSKTPEILAQEFIKGHQLPPDTTILEIQDNRGTDGVYFEGEYEIGAIKESFWSGWVIVRGRESLMVFQWSMPRIRKLAREPQIVELVNVVLRRDIPVDAHWAY
jgi:hypothetical protein